MSSYLKMLKGITSVNIVDSLIEKPAKRETFIFLYSIGDPPHPAKKKIKNKNFWPCLEYCYYTIHLYDSYHVNNTKEQTIMGCHTLYH